MVSEPSTAVYQIQARDRLTQEIAHVNLTLAFALCPLDSMLLEVAQTSHQNSGTEQWKLLLLPDSSSEEEEEEGEVLGEGRGVDCGPSTLQISQFFCLSPGRQFAIQRRIDPQGAASRTGRLTIRSHLPFRASERAWSTLAQLEFDVCAAEWSGEASTFGLDECATFRFASSLLLSRTSEWSLNTDGKVDYSWFEEDFEEDWRWRTATMDSIEQPGNLHLRRWFDAAKRDWEAVDLLFANTGAVWAALNGEYLFDRVCSPLSVVTVRISADRLREGRNLLAIQLSRGWTQSNEAQSVLLRAVYSREPLWVGEELVSMSASSSLPDYYPLLAIDGDPSTLWKGKLENGFAVLKASFQSALAMGISAYCITASPTELETAPAGWKVRVQSADLSWRALQTQNSVWFAHRGEKRCFPVTDRAMQSRVLIAVEFVFLGNAWQTEVSIAELQVKTMAFDRVERPPFLYPQESVPFVLGVAFPRIETPDGFYTSFVTSSPLPAGIFLDSGNGRFFGTSQQPSSSSSSSLSSSTRPFRVVVQAEANSNRWTTAITLVPSVCATPSSLVMISLEHLEDVQSFLSFSLWTADAVLLAESLVSATAASSAFSRAFCVPRGDYVLQFEDASNAGFLATTFSLSLDGIALAHGFFNPGFSSPRIPFHAGLLLPPQSLWYFSFDAAAEPPAAWFQAVDPAHEPWPTASPGQFPSPMNARTQYYKTLLDVGSHTFDLLPYVAIEVQLRVRGGFALYLAGREVLRHRLPAGNLSKDTLPLREFAQTETVSAVLPLQFMEIGSGSAVLAVEVHESVPRDSVFDLWAFLHRDETYRWLGGVVRSSAAPMAGHEAEKAVDGQYYDYAGFEEAAVALEIDWEEKRYEYVSRVCFYTSNHVGTYPHWITVLGGNRGSGEAVEWRELLMTKEVAFEKAAFGQAQCFDFYNDGVFSLLRVRMEQTDFKQSVEVAELEAQAVRLDGFCEDPEEDSQGESGEDGVKAMSLGSWRTFWEKAMSSAGKWIQSVNPLNRNPSYKSFKDPSINPSSIESSSLESSSHSSLRRSLPSLSTNPNPFTPFSSSSSSFSSSRTPSGHWKNFGCPSLYEGRLLRFCEAGSWTDSLDFCSPKAPSGFHYAASLFYIPHHRRVSIAPSVLGVELLFVASDVPAGLVFHNESGLFEGEYRESRSLVEVEVEVRNAGGAQKLTLTFCLVNNQEEWMLGLAVLSVACLALLIGWLCVMMRRSEEVVEREAEMSHLNTNRVPKRMLPLLV